MSLPRALIYFSLNFLYNFDKNQSRQINGQSIATQIYFAINNRLENSRLLRHIRLRTFVPPKPIATHAQEQHILFAMRSGKKNQTNQHTALQIVIFNSVRVPFRFMRSLGHTVKTIPISFLSLLFFWLYFYMLIICKWLVTTVQGRV